MQKHRGYTRTHYKIVDARHNEIMRGDTATYVSDALYAMQQLFPERYATCVMVRAINISTQVWEETE